jgi:YegS/Rv2252/BmrU family lipid kinase
VKASIIFNPQAGTHTMQGQLEEAAVFLQQQGWQITWCKTTNAGHATELACEAANRGDDVAIAVGGDGTLNEVMNGLVGSETALAVLPAGTANVFAAELHIPIPAPLLPNTLKKAAEYMISGEIKRIDVGKAVFADGMERYFLLWAGVGLDAAISQAVETERNLHPSHRTLGMAAWLIAGLATLWAFRGKQMRIRLDQKFISRRVISTTINNSQLYARFWRLAPKAMLDDGLLDVVVLEGYDIRSAIKHVFMVTLGRHTQDPEVHIYRTRQIHLETRDPMPVHLDAEVAGQTPVKIEVVPRSLKIIVPRNAPLQLFTQP